MDISGLNLMEISREIQPYIAEYFTGCKLSPTDGGGVFAESFILDYEEVAHLIPAEYSGRFNKRDKFNGASGFLAFDYQAEQFKDCEYTVMLLSSEDYTKALFLYIQENNLTSDTQIDILLKDFIKPID